MKKLLYFASDYKIGLSALLTDQLMSIFRAGISVRAVAGEREQEPNLANILETAGVKMTRVRGLDDHSDFKRLVNTIGRIVEEESIDIIHVQNNWQLAIAGAVKAKRCLARKIEFAYTLHGFRHNSPIKSKIAQGVIGSALFFMADHVICMTEFLKRKFRMLSYKIDLIPLGVKDNFFIPEFVPPRTDGLHLIFPAQFREGKNQDMIIKAFAGFVRQTDDVNSTLVLPGTGPLLNQMKSLTENLGISTRVSFPGFIPKEKVMQMYLESNIAVIASNSETFGQSIVEPFVLGRCVIYTPVGIAQEIINTGESGFLFTDENDLQRILESLKSDTLLEIGMKNFGRRTLFKWDDITKKYINKLLKQ